MTISTFESLPLELLFEIFAYLSAIYILKSFLLLNTYVTTILLSRYVWHTHIGGDNPALSTFNGHCQRVLSMVGARARSLHVTLTNTIDGWSFVEWTMRQHHTMMLQHLHLVDINHSEFQNLLHSSLSKHLHTLLIDISPYNTFRIQKVEGAYLSEVCSELPALKICRLPFNLDSAILERRAIYQAPPLPVLANPTTMIHLHTLTIGMNTSSFLERLWTRMPLIRNLRVGVKDSDDDDDFTAFTLPAPADSHIVPHLSRLHLDCVGIQSFHRTVALLSSVFNRLDHLSLKLRTWTSVLDRFIVSGDTIQQLCLDRLRSLATYALDLSIGVDGDQIGKDLIFNSFLNAPFVSRPRPAVIIREVALHRSTSDSFDYDFDIFTLPCRATILKPHLLDEFPQMSRSSHISAAGVDLFPHANELFLSDQESVERLSSLIDRESSMSFRIPWSLLTKISIDNNTTVNVQLLETILRLATHVHTLSITTDDTNSLTGIILHHQQLCVFLNQQIRKFYVDDLTMTLNNIRSFCVLLVNRLPDVQVLSFSINDNDALTLEESDCDNKWTSEESDGDDSNMARVGRVVNLLRFLADHLRQLVWLRIQFSSLSAREIELNMPEWALDRPHRRRANSNTLEIWFSYSY